ncbi:hypothetical protein GGI20_002041 [Coemansia sp. BCRC 34301]|nr:hypothetical protein GGI20_002041 [Coemansia sp. BCRC 34301]
MSVATSAQTDYDCLHACQTASPKLQARTLEMNAYEDFKLEAIEPEFADSLVSLTLKGLISTFDVAGLLWQLPKLKWLRMECIVVSQMPSNDDFIEECRSERKDNIFKPINKSLRFLKAVDLQKSSYLLSVQDFSDPLPYTADLELSLHRGLVLDFGCRFPSLDTLRISSRSLEGVKECIETLLDSGIAPDQTKHLAHLRLQAIEE